MSYINNVLKKWKTEYNVYQKDKQFRNAIKNLPCIKPLIEIQGEEVNFSHSGHLGDIIYSIPTMIKLSEGRKINLYLRINMPNLNFTNRMKHPNGNVMLTEKSIELIAPLLLKQSEFNKCEILTNQNINYDLTLFRKFPFDYRMGSIARWYFLCYGINFDLGKNWLTVTPNFKYKNSIIISRSSRYNTPGIDYSFLNKYNNLFFIGTKEEYNEMKKQIDKIEFIEINNFLEMAEAISGSKLFIGNQSFPFSIAEALKIKRVLEVFPQCPNVIVEGENGYDFCHQEQFVKIINYLN
jgi:hypothetical protein